MIQRLLIIFLIFSAVSQPILGAPMRATGAAPEANQDFVESDGFSFIERKEPGWFGGPQTESAKDELALANQLMKDGLTVKAAKQFGSVVTHWGAEPEAPVAQLAYADILFDREDVEDAFKEYQYLVKFYAGQFDYDHVLSQQMKIAHYLMTTPRMKILFLPGFLAPERALPFYRQILVNGPTWKRAPEAQFNVGLISEEIGDMTEAILAYDAVMSRFRGNSLAPDAAFRKAVCLMKMAEKTPRDERSIRDALSAMVSFVVTYPSDKDSDTAGDHITGLKEQLADMYYARAEFYETIKKNDKAAIIAYTEFIRQFRSSKKAVLAQDRIDILKSKQGIEK